MKYKVSTRKSLQQMEASQPKAQEQPKTKPGEKAKKQR